jgi:hypothetical protein
MRIAAFRGESSVRDIAEKLYVDLSAPERRKAVDGLLKANPQLRELDNVKPGTLLHVPDVPKVAAKSGRGLDDPTRVVANLVEKSLEEYAARLAERHDAHLAELKKQSARLKNRTFKKVVGTSPMLKGLSAAATKSNKAEASLIGDRQKRLDKALAQLQADLGER